MASAEREQIHHRLVRWARVDRYLTSDGLVPRIFVEYVGQGDSEVLPPLSVGGPVLSPGRTTVWP